MTINVTEFRVIYVTSLIKKWTVYIKLKCVYRIDCIECGQFYIGKTKQPLYMRFNQHKGDIRHHDRLKSWSEHVKLNHNGRIVKVVIFVLLREKRLTLRKIYEALCIKRT